MEGRGKSQNLDDVALDGWKAELIFVISWR